MGIKLTNNAFATLAAGINSSATSITLTTGQGARFPTLSAGDYFYATLIDTSNNLEIVKCTARSTDVLTVVRAQESTTARAYSAGDRIEIRITAQTFLDAATIPDGDKGDITTSSSGTIWTIDNDAITTAKILNSAVTADKINNGAISRAKIGFAGAVLQTAQAYKTDTYSTTSTSLGDVSGLSVTLTPRDANSKFLIFVNLTYINSFYVGHIALLRGSTEIGMADAAGSRPRNFMVYSHETNSQGDGPYFRESMNFLDSPATTSAVTYKIQASARRDGQGGTFYINRTVTDRDTFGYDPRATSSIVVMEISG